MDDELTVILDENLDKSYQIRITISKFRDETYLHFRKYFLGYEGEWLPSLEGVSMILSIPNVSLLFGTLATIMSKAEVAEILKEMTVDTVPRPV